MRPRRLYAGPPALGANASIHAKASMDAKASITTRRLPEKGTAQLQERSIVAVERVDGDVRLAVRRALDTIQAILMGLDPDDVLHLARSAARGIGTNDRAAIDVRGVVPEPERVEFDAARHNAVSVVETLLRKSQLKKLVFDTPLFRVCLKGAKAYYRVWSWRHREPLFDPIRAHPIYGPQWRPGWPGLTESDG
jgi:hypothetical protein